MTHKLSMYLTRVLVAARLGRKTAYGSPAGRAKLSSAVLGFSFPLAGDLGFL